MNRNIILLLLISLLTACELSSPGEFEKGALQNNETLQQASHLFITDSETGAVNFETNALTYWSDKGCTLWSLLDDADPFADREVGLSKLTGNPTAGYGLIYCYRQDETYGETMLVVMINTLKEYIVGEVSGGIFSQIIPWTESQLLNSGYNRNNSLRLTYNSEEDQYSLHINNQLETTFKDDQPPYHRTGQNGYIVVISPLDDFPGEPVKVQFQEK